MKAKDRRKVCKNCNCELEKLEMPKEILSFRLFGKEFMVLQMNSKDYPDVCISCAGEVEQEKYDRAYEQGYDDCGRQIAKEERGF